MKPAMFAICLISLGACSGESRNVRPVTIQWMDWPAEVGSGKVFRTRLIVSAVCAREPQFHPGARADQSAVTFAPYWVVGNEQIACIADVDAMAPLLVSGFDTAGTAPGLSSTYARTFEMRGSASVYVSGSVSASNTRPGRRSRALATRNPPGSPGTPGEPANRGWCRWCGR